MKKNITVKELREMLEVMERCGLGDAEVWYRDHNDIDHEVDSGVIDTDDYHVVLG